MTNVAFLALMRRNFLPQTKAIGFLCNFGNGLSTLYYQSDAMGSSLLVGGLCKLCLSQSNEYSFFNVEKRKGMKTSYML